MAERMASAKGPVTRTTDERAAAPSGAIACTRVEPSVVRLKPALSGESKGSGRAVEGLDATYAADGNGEGDGKGQDDDNDADASDAITKPQRPAARSRTS